MNKMNLLAAIALPALFCQNAQAQTSRLIAEAHYINDGAEFKRHDSTAYNYLSTARGGDLNSLLKFDDATNWLYTTGDTATNNTRTLQTFDGNNLLTKITQAWDGTFTFSWVNQFKYIYAYTGTRKTSMVTQHWDGSSAWITDSKNAYKYNPAGQLYQDQFQVWDGVSTYVPSSQKTYYYDASGNLLNETDLLFVAGTPQFTSDTDYTYNTANQLLTKTGNTYNGATYVNSVRWTDSLDTAGNITKMLYETYDGTTFVNNMQQLFSNFTSGHKPMTEIDQAWDAGTGTWMDMYKYMYTYNSANQLTSSTQQSYDVSIGWTDAAGNKKDNYYYGSFVNAVANVSSTGGNAAIYPVPAQSTLNIDLSWNQAQEATITICDMSGKVIELKHTSFTAQSHHSINIGNYAAGIYLVKIDGAQGQIVKQIVVAH